MAFIRGSYIKMCSVSGEIGDDQMIKNNRRLFLFFRDKSKPYIRWDSAFWWHTFPKMKKSLNCRDPLLHTACFIRRIITFAMWGFLKYILEGRGVLKDGLDMGPCSSVIKVARDALCVPFEIFYCKLYTDKPWFVVLWLVDGSSTSAHRLKIK